MSHAVHFQGRAIVLDIEGTVSSIRFVHDVMFQYVRKGLDGFLRANWDEPAVRTACDQIAKDAGAPSFSFWCGGTDNRECCMTKLREEIFRLMDSDAKTTGLKELQGQIWREGFQCGELRAPLFPDVLPCLVAWNQAGFDVRIYSSGSAGAQRLFFQHTEQGNLLHYFKGNFDTTIGGKKVADSYRNIVRAMGIDASEILFVSDILAELNAAREAGLQTALSVRPENPPTPDTEGHPVVTDFSQIHAELSVPQRATN